MAELRQRCRALAQAWAGDGGGWDEAAASQPTADWVPGREPPCTVTLTASTDTTPQTGKLSP